MKIAIIVVRALIGLLFLFASVTFFLNLVPQPEPQGSKFVSDSFSVCFRRGCLARHLFARRTAACARSIATLGVYNRKHADYIYQTNAVAL